MSKLIKKAYELLEKQLGRKPTYQEVDKFLMGAGLLLVNDIISKEALTKEETKLIS